MGLGLTEVDDRTLQTLLRAVHRENTVMPLTPIGLAALGLQEQASVLLNQLRGLDRRALHVVLVAILAERGRTS